VNLLHRIIFLSTLLFVSCNSSDDKDDDNAKNEEAIFQFYNAAANSPLIKARAKENKTSYGAANYGDASSVVKANSEEETLEFYSTGDEGNDTIIEQKNFKFEKNEKTFVIIKGDVNNLEYVEKNIVRKELDKHFRLFAMSLVGNDSYDIYMSENDKPFTDSNMLANLNNEQLQELVFWAGDNESEYFDAGKYTVFLTDPGKTDVLFQSREINFKFFTENVLIIRPSKGIIANQIEVAVVGNSSALIESTDINAKAQYRLYNSLNDNDALQVSLSNSGNNIDENIAVGNNNLSQFRQIPFGDYSLSASHSQNIEFELSNQLVSMNQGQSKMILFYQNNDDSLASLIFDENLQLQNGTKKVQLVNLIADSDKIDLYFVASDETVETTKYKLEGLDFAKTKSVAIADGNYKVVALKKNENGTRSLLHSTELVDFDENELYIVTVEVDQSAPNGYKVSVIK